MKYTKLFSRGCGVVRHAGTLINYPFPRGGDNFTLLLPLEVKIIKITQGLLYLCTKHKGIPFINIFTKIHCNQNMFSNQALPGFHIIYRAFLGVLFSKTLQKHPQLKALEKKPCIFLTTNLIHFLLL